MNDMMHDTEPPTSLQLHVAFLIAILHIVLIIFVLFGPWVPNKHILMLYIMVIPFIHMHWITHNDTCALTLMECKLRGVHPTESFFHRLVSPVYKFQEAEENIFVWLVTFMLWLVAIYKYYHVYQ